MSEQAEDPGPDPKKAPLPPRRRWVPVRLHRLAWALLAANVLLVWILPVLPAQDLPEHLAYVRIFADFSSPDLMFRDFYTLPARFQPYDSVYLLLAAIAHFSSVMTAMRLTMSAYVALMFVAVQRLGEAARAEEPGSRPAPISGALATALVWSPVVAMGFLQYFLCIPLVMLTVASFLRWSGDEDATRSAWGAAIGAAIIASVHLAAAGALGLFVVLYGVCNWKEEERTQRLTSIGGVLAGLSVTFAGWRLVGDVLGANGHHVNLADAIRDAQGFEFINTVLKLTWYDPPVTLNYLTWTVLGPFSWMGLIIPLVATLAVAVAIWPVRNATTMAPASRRYLRAVIAFSIVSCFTPWSMQNPSELTYINFRLLALAFALLLPLVPPDWFKAAPQRLVLVGYCLLTFGNLAYRALAFGAEARVPLALMKQADTQGVLLTIVFHNKSDYFGKGFRLTHFLPMYFTIIEGGINSQFWARYTEHLPIDYQPGKKPAQPDDWGPQNFDANKHLRQARWVLLQEATNDDSSRTRADSAKARAALDAKTDRVACDGPWCLFKVRDEAPVTPATSP